MHTSLWVYIKIHQVKGHPPTQSLLLPGTSPITTTHCIIKCATQLDTKYMYISNYQRFKVHPLPKYAKCYNYSCHYNMYGKT